MQSHIPQSEIIADTSSLLTPAASLGSKLQFRKRRLWLFQPTTAWSRLQEFHRRSLGQIENFTLPVSQQLTPEQAANAFQVSLVCALSQFAVIPTIGTQQLFTSLLQHVSQTQSFDGLEALFLTGLNAAGVAGNTQLFAQGVTLWKQIGPPAQPGALKSAPFLDIATHTITFLDANALASLGPQGINKDILTPGQNMGANIQGMEGVNATSEDNVRICTAMFGVAGALGGVLAGGGLPGAGAGAGIGTAAGGAICGAVDKAFDGPATSQITPGEAATSGTVTIGEVTIVGQSGGVITAGETVIGGHSDEGQTSGQTITAGETVIDGHSGGQTDGHDSDGGQTDGHDSDGGQTDGHDSDGGQTDAGHGGSEGSDFEDGESGTFGDAGIPDLADMGGDLLTSLTAGGRSITSGTFPIGPGVESYIGQTENDGFLLQNMPEFTLAGQSLQISNAGILEGIAGFSVQSTPSATVDSSLVIPAATSGISGQILHEGGSLATTSDIGSQILHEGGSLADHLSTTDVQIGLEKQVDQ